MILSEEFAFRMRGARAVLRVVRNNGSCWGRLKYRGRQYDVDAYRDQYGRDDADAAATFIRAAQRGKHYPAIGQGWAI